MVLLRGEAGIGKSRLVEALRERVRREGATRIAFRCSPYYQNSALYPVIDHLQRFLQWQRDETPEAKLDTLERVLRTYRLPLEDVVPLFAALLSVPLPERYPALNLTPQRQRQKTQEALVAWLLEEAERQPVLAVWEDLHWADPSTLELLGLVLDQAPTARMLTLLTCRPEFRPPWGPQAPVTQVILNRLGHTQVETMITHLTGGKALPAEVVQQVVAKTDGIPLFVEELVKMILESGLVREEADRYVLTGPLPPLAIPSTLHDSLMARLDRLSTARELAQLGAVLGREFAYELLQAVSPLDETTLQQGLAQLVDAELVYQRGLPPQSRYIFKHALIQEAAYQSLLKSTRQRYHQRTAQVLEAQFPETVETQPELVAHHYTEAGLAEQAIPYWQRAGQRANERSAYVEAISHFTKGLEVLQALPDTTERAQRELDLQIALGQAFIATKGQAAPEVGHAYNRARELCQQVGETPQLFRVLCGLHNFHLVRAELQTARELSEELLTLAQHIQDPTYLLGGPLDTGGALFCLGEFVPAREHWEQSLHSLRPPAASGAHCPFRMEPGRIWPCLGAPCPMGSGLSGPGPGHEPRGVDSGPGAVTPFQPGGGPGLCGHAPSVPPGAACRPRAGRGGNSALYGAGVCVLPGMGDDHAGLGPGRTGPGRGGSGPDTPRSSRPAGHGGGTAAAVLSGTARRGMRTNWSGSGRPDAAGRGAGTSTQSWGVLDGGRAASAQGGVAAIAVCRQPRGG